MKDQPVRSVETIDAHLVRLYGDVDWSAARGVVHVAAIAEGDRSVIIPGPAAPPSAWDRFVLGVARARADVIVTTGAILRDEPALRHDPSDDPVENAVFSLWRRARVERREPPQLIVMSASGDFPLDHRAIKNATGGFFWTTSVGAARLRDRIGEQRSRLEIVEGDAAEPALIGAIDEAFARPGVETVLIEAGPRASAALYAESLEGAPISRGCDELLLSVYRGELGPAASGPEFVARERVAASLGSAVSSHAIADESGPWRFERYRSSTD